MYSSSKLSDSAKQASNNCNNDFEFFTKNYCDHANSKGNLYTWGSGEMG
jgi:hypothetical protein